MSSNTTGQLIGYVRVSTADQNPARQLAALGDVDETFEEKLSGKNRDRPALARMIGYARAGDTVRVKSPDRLSRSTIDLLNIIEELKTKGVAVEFVDNPQLNTDDKMGSFMLTILAAVAEMERATIRERQAEGIILAKERGVYDRGPKLTPEQITEARGRVNLGVPKAVVARELGVSRTTLYTALAGKGRYEKSSSSQQTANTE